MTMEEKNSAMKDTEFLRNFGKVRSPLLKGTPKCVLVIDGGGLKGYMTNEILRGLEKALKGISQNLELHEAFDLVLGTSTGGLISIALGKLGLTCEEISNFYQEVGKKVFATAKNAQDEKEKEESGRNDLYQRLTQVLKGAKSRNEASKRDVLKILSTVANVGSLSHTELEKIFKKYIANRLGNEDALMYDPQSDDKKGEKKKTKCGVITTLCNNTNYQCAMIIRSYDVTYVKELDGLLPDFMNVKYGKQDVQHQQLQLIFEICLLKCLKEWQLM